MIFYCSIYLTTTLEACGGGNLARHFKVFHYITTTLLLQHRCIAYNYYDTTQLLATTIPLPARHYTLLHFAATISYLSYILLWQVFGPTFEALLKLLYFSLIP